MCNVNISKFNTEGLCDNESGLPLKNLFVFNQQAGTALLEGMGITREGILKFNCVMVYTDIQAKLFNTQKTPLCLTAVSAFTGKKGVRFERETVFYDENNLKFAHILTHSVGMNFTERRVMVAPFMPKIGNINESFGETMHFARTEPQKYESGSFLIKKEHTDANNHTNNTSYIGFTEQLVKKEQQKSIKQLAVKYIKECFLDDTLTAYTANERELMHIFMYNGGNKCFEAVALF